MPFTKQTARDAQVKATQSRKARSDAAKTRREALNFALLRDDISDEEYVRGRRQVVRMIIARIDNMMLTARDGQRMNNLAAASSKMTEAERQLAGRPLPGTLKPEKDKPEKSKPTAKREPEPE